MPQSSDGHKGGAPVVPPRPKINQTNAAKFGAMQKGNFSKGKGAVSRNFSSGKVKGGK
jgi:hypothetical protein